MIEFVSYGEAISIVENKNPHGLFIAREGDRLVGIDNSTGKAWTNDFDSFEECVKWLRKE